MGLDTYSSCAILVMLWVEDKEDVKGRVSLTDTEKEQLNTGEDLVIILRLRDVVVSQRSNGILV